MQIVLLGTGSPVLDPAREHSALIVRLQGDFRLGEQTLLFDAGRGVTTSLARLGDPPQTLGAIFITHHHYDHIGGLGELLLTAWNNGRETRLDVFGPQGTAAIVAALFDQVFARDLAFAMRTDPAAVDIHEVVRVTEVAPGQVITGPGWSARAEQVEHGHALGISQAEFPCLGYRLEAQGKAVAISGDTVACDGLDRLARGADVLVQCCYLAEAELTTPARRRMAEAVLASSGAVGRIAARNGVGRLVLTHFRPKSAELMDSLLADARRDFPGEVILGEDRMVVEL